jgi:hypothetical protein
MGEVIGQIHAAATLSPKEIHSGTYRTEGLEDREQVWAFYTRYLITVTEVEKI